MNILSPKEVSNNALRKIENFIEEIDNIEELTRVCIENYINENIEIIDIKIDKAILNNVEITNSKLENNTFTDVEFNNCNFSNSPNNIYFVSSNNSCSSKDLELSYLNS